MYPHPEDLLALHHQTVRDMRAAAAQHRVHQRHRARKRPWWAGWAARASDLRLAWQMWPSRPSKA